jgi:hypothetical protein
MPQAMAVDPTLLKKKNLMVLNDHLKNSKKRIFQVMQLSDKSCELAEENDRLYDKNKEQRRRIELLETEQSELVRKPFLIIIIIIISSFLSTVKAA